VQQRARKRLAHAPWLRPPLPWRPLLLAKFVGSLLSTELSRTRRRNFVHPARPRLRIEFFADQAQQILQWTVRCAASRIWYELRTSWLILIADDVIVRTII
jgi:hypothetical protein